jgi:uncharacterized protein YoxC
MARDPGSGPRIECEEVALTVLAISPGDIALIVVAAFWGVLVIFLAIMMVNLFRLLGEVTTMVKGVREETVPLLGDVRLTVQGVNKELDRVDTLMESGGKMAKSAERMTSAVEQVVTSPLIKIAAATAGAAAFLRRFRGDRGAKGSKG